MNDEKEIYAAFRIVLLMLAIVGVLMVVLK